MKLVLKEAIQFTLFDIAPWGYFKGERLFPPHPVCTPRHDPRSRQEKKAVARMDAKNFKTLLPDQAKKTALKLFLHLLKDISCSKAPSYNEETVRKSLQCTFEHKFDWAPKRSDFYIKEAIKEALSLGYVNTYPSETDPSENNFLLMLRGNTKLMQLFIEAGEKYVSGVDYAVDPDLTVAVIAHTSESGNLEYQCLKPRKTPS